MVQYYWNPYFQQPNYQQPMNQQPMVPPPVTIPSGRAPGLPQGEQSYIENILRLNIGEPGIFHFSFPHAIGETLNVRNINGFVVAAGRDHVIIREAASDKDFLFPMIYFDYAEFEGEANYFPQVIQTREL